MKADRLVSLLLMLQSAPRRTARDLAQKLEVSERTIYRDVDALSASGVPIYAERGHDGGIMLAEGYRKALVHFGEDEIRALFIPGSAILADLGLGPNLNLALEKLRGGFSEMQRRAAEHAKGRIHIDQRRWNQDGPPVERLALLRRAVWDDRRLELTYQDRERKLTTRIVDAYGLVSKAGVWYAIARTAEGYRSFRVDRIVDVRELDERFTRDATFDLDAYWREMSWSFRHQGERFTATLRVEPQALEAVAGYWLSERVRDDDPCLLRVHFSSESVAAMQIVSWGESVELIEPVALARLVVERAQRTVARYAPLITT
jgi:predicted DNA-binding transcriptional regulator YafY